MNCVFVGSASLLYKLAKEVQGYYSDNINIKIFDTNNSSYNDEKMIIYKNCKKEMIMDELLKINELTYVFSINNPYIISKEVCNKDNLVLINLHHSLLPLHPGRNGEAWTIYNQDEYGGITWHLIDAGVDNGNIICQRKIKLDDSISSIKLLKECEKEAIDSFKELFLPLENIKELKTYKQEESHKINLAKDIPNNGEYDFNWDTKKGNAFLNAMNYGVLDILGKPYLYYNDKKYIIRSYKYSNNGKEEDIKYNVVDDREYLSIIDKYGILDLEIKRMNGETMEELLEILKGIRADVDFEKEEKLIDDSILDSFDIIAIVSELNDHYDIEIGADDLLSENFNSLKAINDLVERLREGK